MPTMPSRLAVAGPSLARLRQQVLIAMGWTILLVGVIVMPLPGPFGLPIMLAGGILLLRNSPSARRRFVRARRRAPSWALPLLGRLDAWRQRARLKRRR